MQRDGASDTVGRLENEATPVWCDHAWPTGATCEGRAKWSVTVPNGSSEPEGARTSRRRLVCDGHLYEAMIKIAIADTPIAVRRLPCVS